MELDIEHEVHFDYLIVGRRCTQQLALSKRLGLMTIDGRCSQLWASIKRLGLQNMNRKGSRGARPSLALSTRLALVI